MSPFEQDLHLAIQESVVLTDQLERDMSGLMSSEEPDHVNWLRYHQYEQRWYVVRGKRDGLELALKLLTLHGHNEKTL